MKKLLLVETEDKGMGLWVHGYLRDLPCTEITPEMLLEAFYQAERSVAADKGKFSCNWFHAITPADIEKALEKMK